MNNNVKQYMLHATFLLLLCNNIYFHSNDINACIIHDYVYVGKCTLILIRV